MPKGGPTRAGPRETSSRRLTSQERPLFLALARPLIVMPGRMRLCGPAELRPLLDWTGRLLLEPRLQRLSDGPEERRFSKPFRVLVDEAPEQVVLTPSHLPVLGLVE